MPDGVSITVTRDDVTPQLKRVIGKLQNPGPLMSAIGVGLVGLTKETFNNPSLRPAAWPAKRWQCGPLKSREVA